jgi:hypothetical protein
VEQLTFTQEVAPSPEDALLALPMFPAEERVALNYSVLAMSARLHPIPLLRRDFRRQGI